ncbi:hypothetical protein A1Q3_06510 [Aliivibrio fischeri ZF-211]|nr:hypothetical protein A1Q3_06510 [Aliivibrio fischeri ZF-211]
METSKVTHFNLEVDMKNAITFESDTLTTLFYTARKKKNHYELVSVESGAMLIRLGKWEYLVEAGEMFWLPFDSLISETVVPNSTISRICFSIRTRENLPPQGGYLHSTPLLCAALNKLQTKTISNEAQQRLLSVIQDEILDSTCHTSLSDKSNSITRYVAELGKSTIPEDVDLSADMMMLLKVREADKLRKSGGKMDVIAERLFEGNVQLMEQAFAILSE